MKTTSKFMILFFTLFFIPVSLYLFSCQSGKKKTQEKMMEEAIESSTGQKTDANINGDKVTLEGENYKAEINTKGGSWPKEIPEPVPEFNYGTINHSTISEAEGTKTWGFILKGVPQEAIGKYEARLKKNGFETMKMTMGTGGNISAEKGNTIVTVIWSEEMTHVSVQLRSGNND